MNDFRNAYNLSSLVKEPTCSKDPDNASCIDLISTNSQSQISRLLCGGEGLYDFHRVVVAIMKTTF